MQIELNNIEIRIVEMPNYLRVVAEIVVSEENIQSAFMIINQDQGYLECEIMPYLARPEEPWAAAMDTLREILNRAEKLLVNGAK